ncbi:MAG TPA: glycosyl hydrolase [Gemmatimonadetes bacterium]|nr:glycosyl hydrolase [Gemmatimonadota bacterium]HIN51874.1 glycosyl hydrolase [Gemmatimonadota bacterium]
MTSKRLPLSGSALLIAILPLLLSAPPAATQQSSADAVVLDSAFLAGYQWRNIGPDRGGRSIAVTGVKGRPSEAYFGAVGGGLWKTTDSGDNWAPVTDFQINSASVGAVAVSDTDPDLIFIGTGETCIRGNILPGDGVYRSRDGGEIWQHVGFGESHGISKIRIHPTNPDVVFVASFGKYGAPSEQRGVFKSSDGGDTWNRVLYRNDETGAIDIVIDQNNPDVLYAALWEAYRKEYQMSSGGPGSGMFKSTDGGETWTEMTRNPGMPQSGLVGRIGLAVSPANSDRVYALFENDDGGLFSSDDAGATWTLVNDARAIRQRAFYYTHVFADPMDEDVVYMQNTSFFRSDDGGETYETINNGTHGDFHDLWIDPDDPTHLVVGNDGGGAVSTNTGESWTQQDFSTAQFYHAVTTAHIPYHVCGSQQDNSTLCLPFNWNASRFGFGGGGRGFGGGRGGDDDSRSVTEGSMDVAYRAGGGEPGYIAPDPKDVDVFYSGTNNGRYVDKFNRKHGTTREVNPYPWFYSGEPAIDLVERWQWTFPIIFSPIDPNRLYVSSQRLWMTTDAGASWTALSGDLTRADPMTLQHSGGPITGDMNGPEVYATIFSVGPGKTDVDVIWTGSDDGLVHVTQDGGDTWSNVTPPGMPDFGRVSQIDASAFARGGAYVSVRLPLLDDFSPYIFKTEDYGQTWTKIVNGIREDAYVNAVREDPDRVGLLYAATQHGVYISYDDGAMWQELNPSFPDIPVVDVIAKDNELVIGTHGRGFWVLDNFGPLRQATPNMTAEAVELFNPPLAVRSAPGVSLAWWLRDTPNEAKLEILDSEGEVLRTFEPAPPEDDDEPAEGRGGRGGGGPRLSTDPGLNHLTWDLRTEPWTNFEGMIFWGAPRMGPAVPPGQYSVRLTIDGRTESAPLTVERNPWIPEVSDEDLRAQYEFSRQVRDKVTEANQAVIAIRRVMAQLQDRLDQSDDLGLAEAAESLTGNASAVEADIYQVRNQSNQDPLNFPIKVNNRLANLMSMAERGDGRPMNNMSEIFDILVNELRGYTDRLEDVWATDLAAVNAELVRLEMMPLDPDCDRPEGCVIA